MQAPFHPRWTTALAQHISSILPDGRVLHVRCEDGVIDSLLVRTSAHSPHDMAVKRTTEEGYGRDAVALMKDARRLFPAVFAEHGIPYTEIGDITTPRNQG